MAVTASWSVAASKGASDKCSWFQSFCPFLFMFMLRIPEAILATSPTVTLYHATVKERVKEINGR